MPVDERDWMAAAAYSEDEFEQPPVERPSVASLLWEVVVLVLLGTVILGLLWSLLGG